MASDTKLYPIPVYGQSFRFIHVQDGALNATGVVSAVLTQTITNGDTTHAPSGDAVFDALAGKVNDTGDTMTGNLNFSGNGLRITGDFSNGTNSNRLMFQTNVANGNTIIHAAPLGTGTVGAFAPFNGSDVQNSGQFQLRMDATTATLNSTATGAGVTRPISIQFASVEKINISTVGAMTFPGGMSIMGNTSGLGVNEQLINFAANRWLTYSTTLGRYQFGNASLEVQGNITSSTNFIGGTNIVLASNTVGGGVIFRPNGAGSATGQASVDSSGNFGCRDVFASRGDGTGVIFLNNALNRYLYYNGSAYELPTSDGIIGGTWHVNNGTLEVGYRSIPKVTSWEPGKMLATSVGQTLTTGGAVGATYSIYNDSGSAITITQGGGLTLRLAGTATTGNRTLAARGFATVWYNSGTEAIISGNVT